MVKRTRAEIARAYRKRKREGVALGTCDVGPIVYGALEYARLLSPEDATDPGKLHAALSKAVQSWAKMTWPFA